VNLPEFLNSYAYLAFALFLLGTALRLGRLIRVALTRRKPRGRTPGAVDAPGGMPALEALRKVLLEPVMRFHFRANSLWASGYVLYHIAIAIILSGYALSALLLVPRVLRGSPVPDVALGLPASHNYSPANLLALVFGNAEHLQANYLFGGFAQLFVALTWPAVLLGLAGSGSLLLVHLSRRLGAIRGDLDSAARGVRQPGRFSLEHLLVTLLVFTIIVTEILARLERVPGVVFYHAALGMTLFAIFPFTYLFHMLYGMFAVYFAVRRRRDRTVA